MAVDPTKLAFYTGYRYEHVANDAHGSPLKGHTAFSVAAFVVTTYTIPHDLGYTPFFKMWYTLNDGKYRAISCGPATYDSASGFQMDNVYSDSNNLYFIADNAGGTGTITGTVYWRIYAEPQA